MRRSVYIIDDERSVRLALGFTLRSAGFETRPFASGADFLDDLPHLDPACLLLDVNMPGMDGLQVLAELARNQIRWPVLVMTGAPDVTVAVEAMKLGASEFLAKPVDEAALLLALERGLLALEQERVRHAARKAALERIAGLSQRELDVLRGLQGGMPNRSLAAFLKLSHRTIEMHRGKMMRKLRADGLPEALRIASDAGLHPLA